MYIQSLFDQLDGHGGQLYADKKQNVVIAIGEAKSLRLKLILVTAVFGLGFLVMWWKEKKQKKAKNQHRVA